MENIRIPLHHVHEALGAKIIPFGGFEMPVRYSSDKEEHLSVRNGVGVFDVSHMGEFLVEGPHALALIQKVTSNDAAKLIDGQAQYSCLPNHEGGIVDDLIVYRFNTEKYLLVVNASNIEKDWLWISANNDMKATLSNVSKDYCLFAVQGPKALDVLQSITAVDLAAIKFYHFHEGTLAGIDGVIISATGYTGAGGFELYVKNEHAESLWTKVFQAGAQHDIKPIGLGARDTLRLEMGYCLYGNDIDNTTSPLEAGLGWITKFSKPFVNSTALASQKEKGVQKKLVAFEINGKGIPRHDYPIMNVEGVTIGKVTSGTMSPSLNKGIGMGYVPMGSHQLGSEIFIGIRHKKVPATICKTPFL
ncbi:glycine cleavage system aminomethyltransferase GcvT [Cyclobacteriaceae bacterium]|jgi:aminomethyltransferase|nr:glycine cleavage system aminomethyltransferase GcvT [Cyclobacteriaceae bacterium]|tara:strand:+ start:459 stop:1541 length:1083 start_codon:yes stop_codon:yes gene_type:complete